MLALKLAVLKLCFMKPLGDPKMLSNVHEVKTIFIIKLRYYLSFLLIDIELVVQKHWWVNSWCLSMNPGSSMNLY